MTQWRAPTDHAGWELDELTSAELSIGAIDPATEDRRPGVIRMLVPDALRLAGHGERQAEETGVRLGLRGVRADGLEEAWALEHVYVDTAPGRSPAWQLSLIRHRATRH